MVGCAGGEGFGAEAGGGVVELDQGEGGGGGVGDVGFYVVGVAAGGGGEEGEECEGFGAEVHGVRLMHLVEKNRQPQKQMRVRYRLEV